MEGLLTTHHEMTHIQYYLQYAHQQYLFRDGANPGRSYYNWLIMVKLAGQRKSPKRRESSSNSMILSFAIWHGTIVILIPIMQHFYLFVHYRKYFDW